MRRIRRASRRSLPCYHISGQLLNLCLMPLRKVSRCSTTAKRADAGSRQPSLTPRLMQDRAGLAQEMWTELTARTPRQNLTTSVDLLKLCWSDRVGCLVDHYIAVCLLHPYTAPLYIHLTLSQNCLYSHLLSTISFQSPQSFHQPELFYSQIENE